MSHEVQIHTAQTKILRELLFVPSVNFAGLHKASGLESDHAKFHIKRLVELGFVEKSGTNYKLSIKGKEYANKLDTDAGVIERQPKVAVLLVVERDNKGQKEYLLQERLKHPYYGYWGAPTGKIRWGETISQTATRELEEETGLSAEFEHRGISHERVVHATNGQIVEDKIFFIMFTDKISGQLKDVFDGGRNVWRPLASFANEPKIYKSFFPEMELGINNNTHSIMEVTYEYSSDEF